MKDPWSDAVDRLTQAAILYARAPSIDSDQNYPLLSYLYCCSVLRHASLLLSVWSAKGWGPLAFTAMLQSGPTPYLPPTLTHDDRNSWANLERLSSLSSIPRSTIAAVLAQVHGPWLLHLGPRERIAVLENMASVYSCLGYRRKEAYILREVLGCILDLVVCGREEDGYSKISNGPMSAGGSLYISVPPNTGTFPSSPQQPNSALSVGGRGQVGVRLHESTDGNASILRLLSHVCRVLGINIDAVKMVDANDHIVHTPGDKHSYEEDLLDGFSEPCGWPELQIGVVREAVAVAEALPGLCRLHQSETPR